MKSDYRDIVENINKEPLWFDENGVPRYRPFHPNLLPSIYDSVGILYEISCQTCMESFRVAQGWSKLDIFKKDGIKEVDDFIDHVMSNGLSYGDPPYARPSGRCCPVGPTQSSIYQRPLQIWTRENHEWVNGFNLIE